MAIQAPHRLPADAGFTLVEMIVAVIIGTIVLLAVSRVAIDSIHGTSKSQNSRLAQTQVVAALESFGKDVHQAQSPDRTIRQAGSPDVMRSMLLQNSVPAGQYPSDITVATPTSFYFVSDVVPEGMGVTPHPECVGWYIDTSPLPARLIRTVSNPAAANAWKNCGPGTPIGSAQTMVTFAAQAGNLSSLPPQVFTYNLNWNRRPNRVPINPNDCAPQLDNRPNPAGVVQRNAIRGVRIDLRAAVAKTDIAEDRLLLTADIQTRLSHDYLYAMGCTF